MVPDIKMSSVTPLLILIILFTLLSFGILMPIITLIILGAMIAFIVRPLALKIKPYVKYETLAIFLAMGILAAPLILIIYFTASQILLLASDIAQGINFSTNGTLNTTNVTANATNNVLNTDVKNLGPLDSPLSSLLDQIGKMIAQFTLWLAGQIVSIIAYLPSFLTNVIILLFSIFYFAKDGDKFVKLLKDILPQDETFNKLYVQVNDILKSIMIVNVIAAVLLGLLSVILYYLVGYPYVLLLGVLTAFAEFIPVVGPWIVYGALGILSIITGNYVVGIIVILVGWLIDTVVDMYLRPRMASKYTQVHPLVLLVGFLFGAITLGLPGLFVGPLIVGIAYVLYQAYRDVKVNENS
jgi:predicted PurR-regulated permease PerM